MSSSVGTTARIDVSRSWASTAVASAASRTLVVASTGATVRVHGSPTRPGRRLSQTQEHEDRRRLSGTVVTEQAENLTATNLQVEVIDGDEVVIVLRESPRPDWRGFAAFTSAPPRRAHAASSASNRCWPRFSLLFPRPFQSRGVPWFGRGSGRLGA